VLIIHHKKKRSAGKSNLVILWREVGMEGTDLKIQFAGLQKFLTNYK
jgi:hypothetical protein